MFWGSDDWAAGPCVLSEAIHSIQDLSVSPDLLVCRGRYVQASNGALSRSTFFKSHGLLNALAFRQALFNGSTPPHQATFFGPGSRQYLASFDNSFSLSADLNYFLCLSRVSSLSVMCSDLVLVHMYDSGISAQKPFRRLSDVFRAYLLRFGPLWFYPFLVRYLRRVLGR